MMTRLLSILLLGIVAMLVGCNENVRAKDSNFSEVRQSAGVPSERVAGVERSEPPAFKTEGSPVFSMKSCSTPGTQDSVSKPVLTASLRTFIDREVAAGFDSEDEIIKRALEAVSHFGIQTSVDEKTFRPIVEQFTKELLAAHREEQKNWPTVTDCDRLEQAFVDLEMLRLVARQNFRTEGSCGILKLCQEIQAVESERKPPRGFVYFYSQDTVAAIEGRGLSLSFGSLEEDPAATQIIGKEIVDVLSRHGLVAEWNGGRDERILVKMDWKRRR